MKSTGIFKALNVHIFLLVLVFFLTENPFIASHGGRGSEESFAFHLGWISILPVLMLAQKIPANVLRFRTVILALFFSVIAIFQYNRYGYGFSISFQYATLFLVYLASQNEVQDRLPDGSIWLYFILALLGAILAVLKPGVWGSISFAFARDERGEFTLNELTGLTYVTLVLIAAKSIREKKWILVYMLVTLLYSSFGSRRYLLLTIPGLILLLSNQIRKQLLSKGKFIIGVGVVAALIMVFSIFYHKVSQYAYSEHMGDLSTGRFDLWRFYWDKFCEHPIMGAGTRIEVPKYFIAETEVGGLLYTLAKFGIVLTLWQLYHIIIAVKFSFKEVYKSPDFSEGVFMMVVLLGTPLYFIEGLTNVLNPAGLIFWYCTFKVSSLSRAKAYVNKPHAI